MAIFWAEPRWTDDMATLKNRLIPPWPPSLVIVSWNPPNFMGS